MRELLGQEDLDKMIRALALRPRALSVRTMVTYQQKGLPEPKKNPGEYIIR